MKRLRDEHTFGKSEQKRTLCDATKFVRYMCSEELYSNLDLSTVRPLEGDASEVNFRMLTTRLFHEHVHSQLNRMMDLDFYLPTDTDTHYEKEEEEGEEAPGNNNSNNQTRVIEPQVEKEQFEAQYSAYHREKSDIALRQVKHLIPRDPITERDIQREVLTLRCEKSPLQVRVLIENYVYVTYFMDSHTRKRYKFNLMHMAQRGLHVGLQHSKNKFSKNDIRFPWGSHLVFESGVVVETGCTSPVVAAKLLEYTLNLFRQTCGYHSIVVSERTCENVVATATLNSPLCLELLKHRYPYVLYDASNDFTGAIVYIADIVARDTEHDHVSYERQKGYLDIEAEYQRRYNRPPQQQHIQSDQELLGRGEYDPVRRSGRGASNRNADKVEKVTALVFPAGQFICVGNKSREGVIESCTKLYGILDTCRQTPENLQLEAHLIRRQKRLSRAPALTGEEPKKKKRRL